jgi:lipopolysaccharide export system protein LptA
MKPQHLDPLLHRLTPPVKALASTLAWALALTAGMGAPLALAERADRSKPMVIEADGQARIDYQQQVLVYSGNVVISQGTMQVRAERVELRETPEGYRTALAVGSTTKPATWRQRRDGGDETVEGSAAQIDFDGRANTLRLRGNSAVRRLRAGAVVDEITGGVITWDNNKEVFTVEGGAPSASNPTGRVRNVFTPPPEPSSAASSAAAGAAPASPARAPSAGAVPLAPTRGLGDRR